MLARQVTKNTAKKSLHPLSIFFVTLGWCGALENLADYFTQSRHERDAHDFQVTASHLVSEEQSPPPCLPPNSVAKLNEFSGSGNDSSDAGCLRKRQREWDHYVPALLTSSMHLVGSCKHIKCEVYGGPNAQWGSHGSTRCPRHGQRAFALSWSVCRIQCERRIINVFLCSTYVGVCWYIQTDLWCGLWWRIRMLNTRVANDQFKYI